MTQSKCTALLIGMFLLLGVVISPLVQAHKQDRVSEEQLVKAGRTVLDGAALETLVTGNTITVVRFENSIEIPIFLKEGGTRFLQWKGKNYSTPWRITDDTLCMDSIAGGTDCFHFVGGLDSSGSPWYSLCSVKVGGAGYKVGQCYWHVHEILEGNPKNLK